MEYWPQDAIFYHIYPLGLTGAPHHNDFSSQPIPRLNQLHDWIGHLQNMGVNALYMGPLFESSTHGYDTVDYYHVDRRLGTAETLTQLSSALHANGIRLILDGVFNHTGRDFWAFRDVQTRGPESPYCNWFSNLRFDGHSPYGDHFTYEGWAGHYDLVKLNLSNPAVREHLFGAIATWIDLFQIDGLRLDAADVIDLDFLKSLAEFCRQRKPGFWLMGEMVHGDYRRLANPQMLDSVTNYEAYKSLYSSLLDRNYFEVAYALNRQFGDGGLYQTLNLYNFADNHDVNRVASSLNHPQHLYPLYCLLFTMPGIPSIYYGSEWGLTGVRSAANDRPLRPALSLEEISHHPPQPGLLEVITRLSSIRQELPALRKGDYKQIHISSEQFAFLRQTEDQQVLIILNAASQPTALNLTLPVQLDGSWVDALNPPDYFQAINSHLILENIFPNWGRILVRQSA